MFYSEKHEYLSRFNTACTVVRFVFIECEALVIDVFNYRSPFFITNSCFYIKFTGMSSNHAGALLYFVKTDCSGSGDTGHCPPYDEDKQLTCVVCTR